MSAASTLHVGVLGASGYAGAELLRLCAGHPGFEVVFAGGSKHAGVAMSSIYPSLSLAYPDLMVQRAEEIPADLDVVFLALPHGASQDLLPGLQADVVIDLGADFRLPDRELYETWYPGPHSAPHLLGTFAFGLVELFRDDIVGARSVAVPGCYVTTAALTISPLLEEGLADPKGIVVDAYSGVTGAGSGLNEATMFATVDENLTAYGLLDHRHTPEMEHALSARTGGEVEVLFTPHLAPMNRGILATCYLRPLTEHTTDELLSALSDAYKAEPFIEVSERLPSTKATLGSNSAHITVRRDQRTGWIVAIGALDNLVKGAAGQAVQCANLAVGFEETTGLSSVGVYP